MSVRSNVLKQIKEWRRKLNTTNALMGRIGKIVLEDARSAFENQRLGDLVWAKLYPGQKPPFLSIGGAIEDFKKGYKAPQSKRFDQNPSLQTGIRSEIYESLKSQVNSPTEVEVSATHEFAKSAQEGSKEGDTVTPITDDIKNAIKGWLYTKKSIKSGTLKEKKVSAGFVGKLRNLLEVDSYTQPSLPRPFLGVTDDAAEKIMAAIRNRFTKKEVDGSGK